MTTIEDRSNHRNEREAALLTAVRNKMSPRGVEVGCRAVLAAAIGAAPAARLSELASLPLGATGHRLVALRYLIANAGLWIPHYAWEAPLARSVDGGPQRVRSLLARIERAAARLDEESADTLAALSLDEIAAFLEIGSAVSDESLLFLVAMDRSPGFAERIRARLADAASQLYSSTPRLCDLIYLASYDLTTLPATTVGEGELRYLIVADKGEMAVRAVQVAESGGMLPVVLFSRRDDANALQVRMARQAGGFAVRLDGSFRESYANAGQIVARLHTAYRSRFRGEAATQLARSALYPGYGPLAENARAIQEFRRAGIVFVGPAQDVVELAGDKRKFRALAELEAPEAVTPGIVLASDELAGVVAAIERVHASGRFEFPGRLKAANGGGGRGQVVVGSPQEVSSAVHRVFDEIRANGWDAGVIFEQNIPETVHLEVQVLRDRFGNSRHFGMRDCTEQRASQKIQEEAPPAILRGRPDLEARMCAIATRLADASKYVGACTVEFMYKAGQFYLLEMNTRIQVEHPVSEESHRIRQQGSLRPVDLVRLQVEIARGAPISFAQDEVVCTHVAREMRINAESWRGDLKDTRDGQRGLFLPNAGVFDKIVVPSGREVLLAMRAAGTEGIASLNVRFDVGFEVGDKLVNKDPTFGKLIVSVAAEPEHHAGRYELLRQACIAVLSRTQIEGRQVNPQGRVVRGAAFATNIEDHVRILDHDIMKAHARGPVGARHVGWVVRMLRGGDRQAVGSRPAAAR